MAVTPPSSSPQVSISLLVLIPHFLAPGGDLLSVGKGKNGRLGRAGTEDRTTV